MYRRPPSAKSRLSRVLSALLKSSEVRGCTAGPGYRPKHVPPPLPPAQLRRCSPRNLPPASSTAECLVRRAVFSSISHRQDNGPTHQAAAFLEDSHRQDNGPTHQAAAFLEDLLGRAVRGPSSLRRDSVRRLRKGRQDQRRPRGRSGKREYAVGRPICARREANLRSSTSALTCSKVITHLCSADWGS
jgi:hypothetical protein